MMIADVYIKGSLDDLTISQLDHVAALLVDDRDEADATNDIDLFIRCCDALDDVLDQRIKLMAGSDPSPYLTP